MTTTLSNPPLSRTPSIRPHRTDNSLGWFGDAVYTVEEFLQMIPEMQLLVAKQQRRARDSNTHEPT